MEAQIASTVLERMILNNGVYMPPDVVMGRYIFFAIDNVDFAEDTPDGKRTLHGTAMAIYQRCHPTDTLPKLELSSPAQERSIKELPSTITNLVHCPKPAPKPPSPSYPSYRLKQLTTGSEHLPDMAWLLGRTLCWNTKNKPADPCPDSDEDSCSTRGQIPVWSAYQSLITTNMPLTRVGTPTLIAAPAHECSTLLTVLMQAQGISAKVMGPNHKTVISLDMRLYKPAKQLQMARSDMDHLILRPEELHIVMAQLRCIGSYIENSGIDFCWTEADLYGGATVRQILDGKHVKRATEAHMTTLQALSILRQEEFFKDHSDLFGKLKAAADNMNVAYENHDTEEMKKAHSAMIKVIESEQVMDKLDQFVSGPGAITMRWYMQMVMDMMLFVRAVRTGDIQLHLTALESFTKNFFAHDKLVYARMIPLYLAEMNSLKESNDEIYQEFMNGNWVVNKNNKVSFCAIGADHALEHVNRMMKVAGGLVGITLNSSARTKFFLIAPELARLAAEASDVAAKPLCDNVRHHALSPAVLSRQERNIESLTSTIRGFNYSYADQTQELTNLATKEVMPENVKDALVKQPVIGQTLFEAFVANRIKTTTTNLWAPMKKCQLQTWKTTGKRLKVATEDKMVELQEDRNLFARMLLVSKSRPEIDLAEIISTYELSVVPRSMFAADGTMLHCQSNLMAILEKVSEKSAQSDTALVGEDTTDSQVDDEASILEVALVDAMAELQSLDKPDHIKYCTDLANHFATRILKKYEKFNEIHVVFDRYDIPSSLKTSASDRRAGKQPVVSYQITDTTNIGKVSMKQLLSSEKTKMSLTGYLAEKVLEKANATGKHMVVAWGTHCKATHTSMSQLESNQEEADTKLMLHAVDATRRGASSIAIHSPDTDVFVLALRRYPLLCKNTTFVTGTAQKRRVISLQPICTSLGPNKIAALPGLHSLSGADNTGSFAGKGKLAFWKAFEMPMMRPSVHWDPWEQHTS